MTGHVMAGLFLCETRAGASSTSRTLFVGEPPSESSPLTPESSPARGSIDMASATVPRASADGVMSAASRARSGIAGDALQTVLPTGALAAHAPIDAASAIDVAVRITARETLPRPAIL